MKNIDHKILVTGGAGHIGSELIKELVGLGYKNIYSLDNYSNGFESNHVHGAKYFTASTEDIGKIFTDSPFDTIFHFGEFSRVEQSFDRIDQVYQSNYFGTLKVLEYCITHNSKLIYSCSSAITSMSDKHVINAPYTISKSANRHLINSYLKIGKVNGAIVYFSNVFGGNENGFGENATVVKKFLNAKKTDDVVCITSPGTQRRNFTYIKDVIDGILKVYSFGSGDGYFIGHHRSLSIIELAEIIGVRYKIVPQRPGNRLCSKLDLTMMRKLGWSATVDIEDFLKAQKP